MSWVKDDYYINVVSTYDHENKYIVWFFGLKHILLDGEQSSCLENCSHRIFKDENEYKKTVSKDMKSNKWKYLKRE